MLTEIVHIKHEDGSATRLIIIQWRPELSGERHLEQQVRDMQVGLWDCYVPGMSERMGANVAHPFYKTVALELKDG